MKRFKAAIACGLALVTIIVLAGCSGNSTPDTPTTRTATVTRGDLTLDIAAAGNLAFSHMEEIPVDLFYQQGTISDVLVQVGDSVTEGQELATLDPDEWQDNLTTLEDAVTTAQRLVATRQQAVDSANRSVATKQQAVTNATNALATDQAQVAAKQLAVTQAELDVTSANTTINNLQDIKAVLDKIDETNQMVLTATMILNAHAVYGIELTGVDVAYWTSVINTQSSVIAELNTKLHNLLSGATPMSTSQAQFQLQQAQLQLQNKQLALSNARAAVEQVQQTIAADETNIEYAKQDVATAQQNVTFAQQDLASAQDSYDTAVKNLQDAQAMSPVITAPFDGVITKVNVAGGDKVVRGTVAVEIADPSRFEANILVSELDILQVKIGDTATVTADAVTGGVFAATVTHISPTATIQSGVVNYGVTVELQALTPIASGSSGNVTASSGNATGLSERLQQAVDSGQMTEEQAQQIQERIASGNFTLPGTNGSSGSGSATFTPPEGGFGGGFGGGGFGGGGFFSGSTSSGSSQTQGQLPQSVVTDYQLREGLTVTVSISIATRTNVLLVPNAAVTTTGGTSYVQVIGSNGQTTQTEVQVGLNDWQNTEITSGLTEGETVLVPLNTAPTSSSSNQRTGGILGLGR